MRISVGPRPEVTVRPEIRIHRPPDEYISLLTKSESEFRKYINQLESEPVFEKLISNGYVKKVNFKGRIPNHVYQEFQDQQFIEFLKTYDVTSKIGWESDFFDKDARRKIMELSAKYRIPRGDLIKALEYCRHLRLSWSGAGSDNFSTSFSLDEPDDFRQMEIPDVSVHSDEAVAILSELLEKYSISEDDFVQYFLASNPEPFDIAREIGINVNAVDEIIESVEKVQLVSLMQVNVVERRDTRHEAEARIIATVKRFKNPPRAEIQIDADERYSFRYNIDIPEGELGKEEMMLLDKLKMVNQRKTLTFRIVGFIYEFQYPYFVSGNQLNLKPLNQAQIAKEVGEHESTVSRILRNKYLETPEGSFHLKFFCQGKKEVIRRIIQVREVEELKSGARSEPFSDAEIAEILEKEYYTKVSRRTVTYYRNKIKESPKFYKRKRKLDKFKH